PLVAQLVVERGRLRRPPRRPLLGRKADGVFCLVQLDRLPGDVLLGRVVRVAPRIEPPEITLRLAMDDPFGDALAAAAGLRDPETEAAALIVIRQSMRRPDIGIAVG